MTQLEDWFVRDTGLNATLSWLLLGIVASLATITILSDQLVVAGFAIAIVAVGIAPAVASRSWREMLPFPFLLVAALPLAVSVFRPDVATEFVSALSIATLALLLVVDLHLLTAVRMTPGFAVFFVVITTMAVAGFWAVGAGFAHDMWGTPFVRTNDQLMYVFIAATVGGLIAGGVFRWYFRRRERADARFAEEVEYA
ncbi:hypothetical protein [Haladaptatus caseinilyticus]|uniref:hypothetical protein n=1 Tax=Haladaptatus caseinilyticus TaxID=2993314 RepID=UPI00224AB5BA|nr:hypothetical protein [Haladaptatus caseinilyticus]